MDDRLRLGQAGEKQAERFLRRQGCRTVTRNYHCPLGEIDLIALDGSTIVFVEVKTRSDREHADPQDAVNPAKQQRIAQAARFFMRQTGSEGRLFRFDVVAVVAAADGSFDIEHLVDAFSPVR